MTRYASPLLLSTDGSYIKLQVVELISGKVERIFSLTEELSAVIWLQGLIQIVDERGGRVAYHLFPYDLINIKSVDETRRIPLR
jgi:hypothetical protein